MRFNNIIARLKNVWFLVFEFFKSCFTSGLIVRVISIPQILNTEFLLLWGGLEGQIFVISFTKFIIDVWTVHKEFSFGYIEGRGTFIVFRWLTVNRS